MSCIGRGAFGQVYIAQDLQENENVAIKIESPTCKKPVLKLEISILKKANCTTRSCRLLALVSIHSWWSIYCTWLSKSE